MLLYHGEVPCVCREQLLLLLYAYWEVSLISTWLYECLCILLFPSLAGSAALAPPVPVLLDMMEWVTDRQNGKEIGYLERESNSGGKV